MNYYSMNIKSHCHDFATANVDVIYLLPREDIPGLLTPTFDTETDYTSLGEHVGIFLQNNTDGIIYLFYGELPDTIVDRSDADMANWTADVDAFKTRAFKIQPGQTFEPFKPVGGLLYILSAGEGCIHHIVH